MCRVASRRLLLSSTFVAALLFAASEAHASDPLAERLYREGRAAAQARDWNHACQLFQDSQNREPAPGTLLNLADCEEHRGKILTAAAQYNAAARLFQAGDERIAYAKNKASALEARAAKLRIRLEGDATVTCDGVLLDGASFGAVIPMDPGEHVFVVKAKERADVRTKILLREGEAREIELAPGPLLPAGAPVVTNAPAPAPSTAPPQAVVAPPPPETRAAPNRTPAYVAFGIGAAGLGLGVVTGVLALDSASSVASTCPNRACASDADVNAAQASSNQARAMAITSTIGVGVGVAAAAIGTYLLLRKSSSTTVAPTVGDRSAGFLVRGTF